MEFRIHKDSISIPDDKFHELCYAIRDVNMMIIPEPYHHISEDYHISLTSFDIHTIERTIDLLKYVLNTVKGE